MAGKLPRESLVKTSELLLEMDKTLIRDGSGKEEQRSPKNGMSCVIVLNSSSHYTSQKYRDYHYFIKCNISIIKIEKNSK